MTVKLSENVKGGILGKVEGKRLWHARIIAKGQGSSGFYSEAALKETGAAAFPVGTKINLDHQSFEDYMSQPAGSLASLIGVVASEPVYKDDGDDLAGLYADVEFIEAWAPFVEQVAPFVGLSINASGYGEDYTDDGSRIIEGFIPSVLNTVDLVTAPGAKGQLLHAIESYRETSGTIIPEAPVGANPTGKDKGMTPEEIEALKEALVTAIKESITTSVTEALKPAEVEPEEKTDAPDMAAVAEAAVKADLPEPARAKVYEAVKNGAKVEEAIDAEKKYIESVKESAAQKPTVGNVRTVEAASASDDGFRVGGW